MTDLDGTTTGVEVAPGYWITAPGLRGSVEARLPRPVGSADRGPELATEAFDAAARESGLREVMKFELHVQEVPLPPAAPRQRAATGEDAFVLETPDLGPEVGQVVLALDEAGAVTWNFPETADRAVEVPATRGAGGKKRFVIRQATPAPPATGTAANRGIFGAIGRKLLKVLIYPVTDAILGPVSQFFAGKWEETKRPYLVRAFGPGNYVDPMSTGFGRTDWDGLDQKRALLFLHGTFSTSHDAFHHLPAPTMEELHRRYEGRVFAFNHYTLSHTPQENVQQFAKMLPHGIHLDLDIVAHSRGGLVARTLAGELSGSSHGVMRMDVPGVTVRRAVFVATPNHGTALADADHLIAFIDRFTTLLNLAPPGPAEVVADVLEAIITAVKVIGHAIVNGLPGLQSMAPKGGFINAINGGTGPAAVYFSIAANYEPDRSGPLWPLVRDSVKNSVIDRVFGEDKNDLVVPTLGVSAGSKDPVFPITSGHSFTFSGEANVHHNIFFAQAPTSEKLLSWLPAH
ncbi:lipase family alpha/beta hydrolase [Agromyces bracchium]|uniref:DUF7379 domain-containing protein n=1 Tax=Agromyces bracchium TaxID=88376 RepID=A0A6I3MCV7_9MICO|nr:hypothetical protein [Agromyces bracchium]MTH69827.1 hypothetical protein [Agromyces bracchium]